MQNAYEILVGEPQAKRPLDCLNDCLPRREDNIKMSFKDVGYEGAYCIQLAHGMVQWRAILNAVSGKQT
jgi:hypothetical protein